MHGCFNCCKNTLYVGVERDVSWGEYQVAISEHHDKFRNALTNKYDWYNDVHNGNDDLHW